MKKKSPGSGLRAALRAGFGALLAALLAAGCESPQGAPGPDGANVWEGPFRYSLETEDYSEPLTDLGEFSAALRTAINGLPEAAGDSPETPLTLAIEGLNLSEPEQVYLLYRALTRYVDLDLRGCAGVLFAASPGSLYGENKAKIVSLQLPDTVMALEPDAGFANCEALTTVDMPGLRYIDNRAFPYCNALISVTAPNISSIGNNGFGSCVALEAVDFPQLVSIGDSAFQYCAGLETLRFPKLESAGNTVFLNCRSLTSLELPMLTSIGNAAFQGCISLKEITLGPTPPQLGTNIFTNAIDPGTVITFKVPAASIPAYRQWNIDNDATLGGTGITRTFASLNQ
jgi:hypothetical protein